MMLLYTEMRKAAGRIGLGGEDTKVVFMFILSVGMLVLKRSIEYQDGDVT